MTTSEVGEFKRQLEQLQLELKERGPHRFDPNRTSESQVGEDEDEQPLNEMLQSIASSRNKTDAKTLSRIGHALKKIAEDPDEFGLCEICGDEIATGRMKAMPFVECCVGCQDTRDGRGQPTTRKKITDYV